VKELLNSQRNPTKRSVAQTKRVLSGRKKRYLYARTQEIYKKEPGALARYIREGIPWPESVFPLETITEFYTELWWTTSEVTIPFDRTPTNDDEALRENVSPHGNTGTYPGAVYTHKIRQDTKARRNQRFPGTKTSEEHIGITGN